MSTRSHPQSAAPQWRPDELPLLDVPQRSGRPIIPRPPRLGSGGSRRHRRRPRLEALTDAQLHALFVRVQTLLLDRPHTSSGFDLAVDLVRDDEARVLALYRALPPDRRREGLARVADALGMCAERPLQALPEAPPRVESVSDSRRL